MVWTSHYYNPNAIMKFYKYHRCTGFLMLKEERISEIEAEVARYFSFMAQNTKSLGELMTRCAEKLLTASKKYGVEKGDEAIFFFIKTIDPDFLYIEAFESANKKEEVKPLCLRNFNIYDPFLIYYEKLFQRRFRLPELEDLWARGKIDTSLLNEHGITK